MIKKYAVLAGMIISLTFLLIAIYIYPGGTYQNKLSHGFDWTKNYFSNLFDKMAVNGQYNSSRPWAYCGLLFYCISCALFFVNMSKKIPEKNGANIIKYSGLLASPFTLLIATPYHDLMLTISSFLFWTSIFSITIFILKSRLRFLKFYCCFCLAIFYYAVYIHASNNWDLLPIIQKVNFISAILLILGLEYFTSKEDFAHIKPRRRKALATIR